MPVTNGDVKTFAKDEIIFPEDIKNFREAIYQAECLKNNSFTFKKQSMTVSFAKWLADTLEKIWKEFPKNI